MREIDQDLLRAAAFYDIRHVIKLLNLGANVNAVNGRGSTALHLVAYVGDKEKAGELIKRGANVNAVNYDGNTALYLALINGKTETARELLNHGATADEELANEINELFKRQENPVNMVKGEDGLFRSKEYLEYLQARVSQKAAATSFVGAFTKRKGTGVVSGTQCVPKDIVKIIGKIIYEKGNTKSFMETSEEKSR